MVSRRRRREGLGFRSLSSKVPSPPKLGPLTELRFDSSCIFLLKAHGILPHISFASIRTGVGKGEGGEG